MLRLVAMKMHRRGTTGGSNGFNDRISAVRVQTGESYRDTLPVSTFVPWAAVVRVIKVVAGLRHYLSHASCISSAVLCFPRATERLSSV
jgi:hypothetical protein